MSDVISRDDVQQVVEALSKFFVGADDMREFAFPVSRRCRATIKFSGHPTIDDWDSLLAHIAFYRKWYATDLPPSLTITDVSNAVMAALEKQVGA